MYPVSRRTNQGDVTPESTIVFAVALIKKQTKERSQGHGKVEKTLCSLLVFELAAPGTGDAGSLRPQRYVYAQVKCYAS